MKTCFLQARVDEDDKEKANEILQKLGTNYSAVISMLLKQIILTQSIPFNMSADIESEKEKKADFIKRLTSAMNPGDTIELALTAKTPEDREFYERLGNYILQVGQKMAIEENLY